MRTRSRFLVGAAAAWLLGAVMATGGSMLAVNSLAHGLLGPGPQQLTQTTVQNDLAGYHAPSSQPAATRSGTATGDEDDPETGTSHQQSGLSTIKQAKASRPNPGSGSSLLVSSAGGTVMTSCQSGLAYLQYWSPAQGYRAHDVFRGPALQASVGFESLNSEAEIRVTCNGSHPVAHVLNDSSGGWNH
jgi:hypothetical protein